MGVRSPGGTHPRVPPGLRSSRLAGRIASHRFIARCNFNLERELVAFAEVALNLDVAAHQAHELSAYDKAQPRAAAALMHVADLLERPEEPRELLFADGFARVLYFETQSGGRRESHAERDLTLCGELHRVVQQIQEHLAKPAFVGPDRL